MNGRKWTEEEDEFLRKEWHKSGRVKIADLFGRSIDAVNQRASMFGLTKKTWSKEELRELKKHLPKMGALEIGKLLNRTPEAVRNKARLLGMKGGKEHKDDLQRTGNVVSCCTCGRRFYLPKCQIKKCNYCCLSCSARSQENKERLKEARAILSRRSKKTLNKPERKLSLLLKRYFPEEFDFNGNFNRGVMLNGLIPDFVNVNGKKQVLELFGTYWHDKKKNIPWKSTEFGRKAIYSQLGFDCLVIWEQELKSPKQVIKRVEDFIK